MIEKIDLKIGFFCNNRCKFCVQGEKRNLYGNRRTSDLKKIIRQSAKEAQEIVFTGGEPTIHEDFLELVAEAKKAGFKDIQIQTNARRFAYKKFCEQTIAAGATEFSPALHGPNAKIHDFLTSSPGSFEQTTRGIKNLKELGQTVITNTVITTKNYKFLPRIAKLLVSLGVDQFQFAFPHITGSAAKNKDWLIPRKTQVIKYVKKGLDIGIKAGKTVMTEAIPLCFMKGYEDYIAEKAIPDAKVFDAQGVIEDYTAYRKNEGKKKGPKCPECKYFKICEGPWKEYPEIFGWSEFKPVR
ncbi:MAG: putative Fe-S oxidoreductase [Parcubacteria group bacterium LiPW_39]|nr:MAG: putative Fe-S oxidoreductase [Parcubacteria group bacterium LiPW_39]